MESQKLMQSWTEGSEHKKAQDFLKKKSIFVADSLREWSLFNFLNFSNKYITLPAAVK